MPHKFPGLDIEDHHQLRQYLVGKPQARAGEIAGICNLAGGVSNRTVLVQFCDGSGWVVKQALEKLRVAVDWFSEPQRIHREALGMECLHRLAPAGSITPLVFEDEPNYILAMAAVPQPHANWKTLLMQEPVQLEDVLQFADLLAAVHSRAWEQRSELRPIFDESCYFESLRLEPYYAFAAQQTPAAAGFLNELITETRAQRLTLVHGDYSPKNILKYEDKLILLDHEVIHWGDPAFDIGFSLTHLLSKAHHFPARRREFAQAANFYWQRYMEQLGAMPWQGELEPRAVCHTLACLLARVAGRSPLEYLDASQRTAQRKAVVALMQRPPLQISILIDEFTGALPDVDN